MLYFSIFKVVTLCLEFVKSHSFYHPAACGLNLKSFLNNSKGMSMLDSYWLRLIHYFIQVIISRICFNIIVISYSLMEEMNKQ